MTTTDTTRRVAPSPHAAEAVASLLDLVSDLRGATDLREVAISLRELAGMLDRIADRRAMPSPGAAYDASWARYRG